MIDPLSTAQLFSNLEPKYFSSKNTWLVKTDGDQIFRDVYLPITSQVYSFNKVVDDMVVRESYNVVQEQKTISKQIGIWKERELTWDDSSVFERRKDFYGHQFEAVTLEDYPTVTVHKKDTDITIGGFFGEVWNLLENHLNFSTRIRISPDGRWGGSLDLLLSTCYLLLTKYYLLHATCYFLLATFYLLLSNCYLLLVACYLPLAIRYILLATCY